VPRYGVAGRGTADEAALGMVRRGGAECGVAVVARCGTAWLTRLGSVSSGAVWFGVADTALCGWAWRSMAERDSVRHG